MVYIREYRPGVEAWKSTPFGRSLKFLISCRILVFFSVGPLCPLLASKYVIGYHISRHNRANEKKTIIALSPLSRFSWLTLLPSRLFTSILHCLFWNAAHPAEERITTSVTWQKFSFRTTVCCAGTYFGTEWSWTKVVMAIRCCVGWICSAFPALLLLDSLDVCTAQPGSLRIWVIFLCC